MMDLKVVSPNISLEKIGGNLVNLFEKIIDQYIDQDIVQIQSEAYGNMYYILNTKLIKEIVVKNSAKLIKIPHGNKILESFIGNSVFVSNGQDHKQQRRWMNPVFNRKQFKILTDGIVTCTQEHISNWGEKDELNIFDNMMNLTIGIIIENIFGKQVSEDQREIVVQTLDRLLQVFRTPKPLTSEEEKEVLQLIETFDQLIYEGIKLRKENPEQYPDLLSMLVQTRSQSEHFEGAEQEIRNNVSTLFLAGYEAIATALTWTWYLLARHSEVEKRFWNELDSILPGKLPNFLDIQKLLYTNQILLESMRLYPPSYQIGRAVIEDIELGTYTIPKNSALIFCQYIMHRNEKYFAHPNAFKPERFSDKFINGLDKYAYFPFGLGSRICLGKDFSLGMMALVLAVIGKQYRLELINKEPIQANTLTTLNPITEMKMKVYKRE